MSIRTHPDDLTIAYIAIGVEHALQAFRASDPFKDPIPGCGHIEIIDRVIEYALMLDRLADAEAREGGFTGVFCYDVAEAFGDTYATALFHGEEPDADALAAKLIKEATCPST